MMNGNTGRGIPAAKGGPIFGKGFALSYNVKGGGEIRGKGKGQRDANWKGGLPPARKGTMRGPRGAEWW
jgi:hypothetical protein